MPEIHFRETSCEKDEILGFSNYVHTFLLRWQHSNGTRLKPKKIPILDDKLVRGYPHVCLKIPTIFFNDPILSWWNIAKGHPKGSAKNWSAKSLLDKWQWYRDNHENDIQFVKGFFNDPMKVPTIINICQLNILLDTVGSKKIKRRMLELLQRDSLSLLPNRGQKVTVEVFCQRDLDLIDEYLTPHLMGNYDIILINPEQNGYRYKQKYEQRNQIFDYYCRGIWEKVPKIVFD